ncbi:hypothetical protein AAW01_12980 [Aurantiacibacter gangjinensis]|uniref:Uncharacterized protein n=1 Tax=Aurantiacibacter gangjinensis TaxID=502682 RepID=A0A0G9MKD4_9SPHN|nr:hypothetical protein AAW01_12980 [Aurantiacibacter gangjinensis]
MRQLRASVCQSRQKPTTAARRTPQSRARRWRHRQQAGWATNAPACKTGRRASAACLPAPRAPAPLAVRRRQPRLMPA